jgi:hypothetical protein
MLRQVVIGLAVAGALGLAAAPVAAAQAIRVVTADDFVPTRILEVEVGTEAEGLAIFDLASARPGVSEQVFEAARTEW